MNYISKLKTENENLKNQFEFIDKQIVNKLSYLQSEKFRGFENNYVNAEEVQRMLYELRQMLMTEL
jgi:hypothetical protein